MSRRDPSQEIAPHFTAELLAHAEKIDVLNRRQAYESKLDAAKMMQALNIADEVIEGLLCITLRPEDRRP